ncbi:MAG: aminoacyl-tRNA hydrolase [Bacteroidetes bacterium GWE2_29_8]|nr:MAG: aminoacyl-tRNA hydrolase [Bacteroidetes bacterium GWE2_29_8]
MKYLIVGLGNPGAEYEYTRHNIGYLTLDRLAADNKQSFTLDRHAYISEIKFKGRVLKLIKPTTFMNLSGKALNYWMQKENITDLTSILVICDDISLPLGKLRIKPKGSDGGHNGLTDIIRTLGNVDFPRLRIGIGNNFLRGMQSEYVLGRWSKIEEKEIPFITNNATDVIKSFVTIGIELTMTQFNNKN